jgi:hypothetical protein
MQTRCMLSAEHKSDCSLRATHCSWQECDGGRRPLDTTGLQSRAGAHCVRHNSQPSTLQKRTNRTNMHNLCCIHAALALQPQTASQPCPCCHAADVPDSSPALQLRDDLVAALGAKVRISQLFSKTPAGYNKSKRKQTHTVVERSMRSHTEALHTT